MSDETKRPPEVDFPEAAEENILVVKSEDRQRPRRKQGLFPFMPVHVKDAYAETRELSTAGQAAYFSLTCQMWMHGGSLPDDDIALARMVGWSKRKWQRVKPELLKVFETNEGSLTHRLLAHEHQRTTIIALKRSAISRVRWSNNKDLAYANAYAPTPTQEKRGFPRKSSPLRELPSPTKHPGNGAVTLTPKGEALCSALERLGTAIKG